MGISSREAPQPLSVQNNTERDALSAYDGMLVTTKDYDRLWLYSGTEWLFLAGPPPRFRLVGGGAGQTAASGSNTNCTWVNGTEVEDTESAIAVGTGVFTCPAPFAGRWSFEYAISFDSATTGIRAAWLTHSLGGTRYAQASQINQNNLGGESFATGAEIVLAASATVVLQAYQTSGANRTINQNSWTYFQGRYIGKY